MGLKLRNAEDNLNSHNMANLYFQQYMSLCLKKLTSK